MYTYPNKLNSVHTYPISCYCHTPILIVLNEVICQCTQHASSTPNLQDNLMENSWNSTHDNLRLTEMQSCWPSMTVANDQI